MGFVVGIISFIAGVMIFVSNLASLIIGLPLANKFNAQKAKKIYSGNIIFGIIMLIVVIVLMSTVLSQYALWILFGYFIIPLIIFVVNFGGYAFEANNTIGREMKEEVIDGIILTLSQRGEWDVLLNIKSAYNWHNKDMLDQKSLLVLRQVGLGDDEISELFKN